MARRRRRSSKKHLSGLGALALDPKVLIGLGLIAAVGAYFLLMPKDADAAVPPGDGGLVPPPTGPQLPTDTGTGTPATPPPAPVVQTMPPSPVLTNLIQKTEGRGGSVISIPGMTSGGSTGTSSLINKLRSSGVLR